MHNKDDAKGKNEQIKSDPDYHNLTCGVLKGHTFMHME